MMNLSHRALVNVLAVSALSLPLVAAVAAPAKKAGKPGSKPAAKAGDPKAGQTAFKSEGCTGCHKTKDYASGGEVGTNLTDIGGKKKPAEIAAYIAHPKAGSVMPAFKGPKKTLDNLTAYLATQK